MEVERGESNESEDDPDEWDESAPKLAKLISMPPSASDDDADE